MTAETNRVTAQLTPFLANSANASAYPALTIASAKLYPECLSQLLVHIGAPPTIHSITDFKCLTPVFQDRLRDLFLHYGSDKSSVHNYHILYAYVVEQLGVNSELSLLEIGLGTNNPKLVSSMGARGKPGASVRAFRDMLPNSHIIGADIDRDILFTEDRIETVYVDQLTRSSFADLEKIHYDVIIDDGLHSIGANLNTLLFALPRLKMNGWVIIEDIGKTNKHVDNWFVVDHILKGDSRYETFIVEAAAAYMFVVHRVK